jgi:hypothetical protein
MKTKTINQIGIDVRGTSLLNLWGGGQGTIEMESYFLPYDKITHTNILRCVNDGQFGCESIESAEIDIYIIYDNGCSEYDRTITVYHTLHSKHFLGWHKLREQGIKC